MSGCTRTSNKIAGKNPIPSPISRQLTGNLAYFGRGEDVCLERDDRYEPQIGAGSSNFCSACLEEEKKRSLWKVKLVAKAVLISIQQFQKLALL